jgi:hypothetical protein
VIDDKIINKICKKEEMHMFKKRGRKCIIRRESVLDTRKVDD